MIDQEDFMKKLFVVLALCLLAGPHFVQAADEESTTTTVEVNQATTPLTEYQGQAIADYLKETYFTRKMDANDRIQAYYDQYQAYKETEDYQKLLAEDPHVEKFDRVLQLSFQGLMGQLDQIFLVHLKDYQTKMAESQALYEEEKLEVTEDLVGYIAKITASNPKEVQKKTYNQDQLLEYWQGYHYFQQASQLSEALKEAYHKHFPGQENLEAVDASYAENKDKIHAMYQDFIGQLEFVDELSQEEIDQIESGLQRIEDLLKVAEDQPVEEAVKDGQIGRQS